MRLPPLNALKAFEAAARLGSFVRAGEELNVSPGAVSRHVKLLEAHFGTPLFERLAQGLRPTATALALLPKITAAFEMIGDAASEVPGPAKRLSVIASPTFANRLLVPRLPRFSETQPNIMVSVSVLLSDLTEFEVNAHDCAIATFHEPVWPENIRAVRVKAEALTPVCAPSLLASRNQPLRPEELGEQTMLHIEACTADWPNWLERNGLVDIANHTRGPRFETGELAIRAAVEGLGVIVMDRFLIADELRDGSLVDLFPQSDAVDNGYFFFCAERRWDETEIAAFRDWAIAEFADPDRHR